MPDIVAFPTGGSLTEFDPTQTGIKVAALSAAVGYAKKIKDWDSLREAVDAQIKEQGAFVAWWRGTVTPRLRSGTGMSADLRSSLSKDEAETQTGISHQQVSRWGRFLQAPEAYAAMLYGAAYAKAMGDIHNHRAQGTGENEWYTPPTHLDLVRKVLGEIDLDPASSEIAQKTVGAKTFFTKEDDGLAREWHGNVFLNPPYTQPDIALFSSKMVAEVRAKRVVNGIMLTHNYTDTAWFHELASEAAAICFTRGRVKFVDVQGNDCAPTQGQAFFYFGDGIELFAETFMNVGFVVTRYDR